MSKPSPDGYLDLEIESGTITFETEPSASLKSFEITTAFATNGWIILDNPRIELSHVRLTISYDSESGVEATLFGTFTIENLQITLFGKKANDKSIFQMVVSKDVHFNDLMQVSNDLSPSDKQGISVPLNAGLPKSLSGSFSTFKLSLTPDKQVFVMEVSLNLESWVLDLNFTRFTAKQLGGTLHWEKSIESDGGNESESKTVNYSLRISAHLSFDSIPVIIELDLGSTSDTVVVAKVNDPSTLQLSSIVDKTLGFASDNSNQSLQFTDLLPQDTSPFAFQSGYLQFNLTRKIFLLVGTVRDMGACLLIAGLLKGSSDLGYALTIRLPNLSNLLNPLVTVDKIISVRNINASVLNLGSLNIADLTSAVKLAESNLAQSNGQPAISLLPFENLSISPDNPTANIQINAGLAFYCELFFSDSLNQLMKNFVLIQPDDNQLASVVIFAQYSGKKAVVESKFIAKVSSINLFGELEFKNIAFEFTSNISGEMSTYTLSLSGSMIVPLISSTARFYGDLKVLENKTTFRLVGDDQPLAIMAPLKMFGISFEKPKLEVTYNYRDNDKFDSEFSLSGKVNFFSTPNDSGNRSPSFALVGECVWVDGSPSMVSITLPKLDRPLTLTDLVATVFDQAWDTNFLDIGLYEGEMYYSTKDVTIAEKDYKLGYHISCKTFIFNRSFVIQVDASLEQTGFSISGSATQPFDLGFSQISTAQVDDHGNFKNLGPTLSYSHLRSHTELSMGIGLTFLDIKVAAITINYLPSKKAFIFTVMYPEKFLGIKPSVSCSWSEEGGFEITSWSLGSPDVPGFDEKLIREIKAFANKPTAKGCAAIADFVFRQTIKTKFHIDMHTA